MASPPSATNCWYTQLYALPPNSAKFTCRHPRILLLAISESHLNWQQSHSFRADGRTFEHTVMRIYYSHCYHFAMPNAIIPLNEKRQWPRFASPKFCGLGSYFYHLHE